MGDEGTFYPPPSKENPFGFYENVEFRIINDSILEGCKYQVKSWSKDIPKISSNLIDNFRALRLIRKYQSTFEHWGFKDPRSCLTLGSWLWIIDVLRLRKNSKVLYVFRDPASTAISLNSRGNTDVDNALELWLSYNQRAISSLEKSACDVFFVEYKDLLEMSSSLREQLQKFLNVSLPEESVENFVAPSLNRSGIAATEVLQTQALPAPVMNLYEDLQRRASY